MYLISCPKCYIVSATPPNNSFVACAGSCAGLKYGAKDTVSGNLSNTYFPTSWLTYAFCLILPSIHSFTHSQRTSMHSWSCLDDDAPKMKLNGRLLLWIFWLWHSHTILPHAFSLRRARSLITEISLRSSARSRTTDTRA